MILNVSSRTDIVAFYTEWFINRYQAGFIDVRNPFNYKMVNRIYFNDVDLILFCTKNPLPILPYISIIKQPIIFHITLTPYKNDIEPNVPNKSEIINAIKIISTVLGSDNVIVRYDPILINDIYTIEYHIRAFKRVCCLLEGYVNKIIISFIDEYKNVSNNYLSLNYKKLNDDDYQKIGINFYNIASSHKMTIQTCCEKRNLSEYGFIIEDCISQQLAYILTGKKYKKTSLRECNCVQTVDIGVYNTCSHFCKYCYANYDEKKVQVNQQLHNPESTMLVGKLEENDIVKIRRK